MHSFKRPTIASLLGRALSCLAALFLLPLPAAFAVPAQGDIPLTATAIQPTVRVLLRRLNITDRMDVTLSSAYGLTLENGTELCFRLGSQLSFQLKNGRVYLYYAGLSLDAGTDVTLRRYADGEASEIGFRLTNYPALYIGDLRLTAADGALRPILSMHVEDYLLGVVPYEMSDSFPIEALKAQTVAARTYVLRKQSADRDYDVVDTTNDQVFKGYESGFLRVEKAVAETYGVCGFYRGKLAQCYYAASNGGRTERVESVWDTQEDFGYYAAVEDASDLENPLSIVKSAVIQKRYTNQGKDGASFGLRRLLAETLSEQLLALGYDPTPESVRVHEVSGLLLDTPADGETPSRPTMLHMTVAISGRTRTEGAPAPSAVQDPDPEEVGLFAPLPTASPLPQTAATPEATETPAPTPSPTPVPVYGAFVRIQQPFALDIPVFPTAENALGMNISTNYENEMWSLVETDAQYTLEARRFGHGVGMSQRGAEWMAGHYEKSYREILTFYYPGMELMRFEENDIALSQAGEELSATAGPAPSPTPRPTLMPTTLAPTGDQWMASVTGIDDDSSLNLRSLPDRSGDILMRLFKNQRLLVVERCQEDGWVKVQTDVTEGYVMESFLSAE